MKVECQHCKTLIETAEEVAIGQHILCPACGKKFSYGEQTDDLTGKMERPIRVEVPSRNEACAAEIKALRKDVIGLAMSVSELKKKKVSIHWSLELLLILMLLAQISSCASVDGLEGSVKSIYERMGEMKLY